MKRKCSLVVLKLWFTADHLEKTVKVVNWEDCVDVIQVQMPVSCKVVYRIMDLDSHCYIV